MVLSWLLSLSSATGKTCEYIFFKPIISIIFAEGQGGHKQPMLMSHTHTHSMIMWKRAWYVRMIKRGHINYDLSLIFLSFGAFIVCMNGFMRCINVRCAISMECRMMHHAWMQTSECWKTSTAHWRNLKGTITLSLLHECCNVFAVIFEAKPNENGKKKIFCSVHMPKWNCFWLSEKLITPNDGGTCAHVLLWGDFRGWFLTAVKKVKNGRDQSGSLYLIWEATQQFLENRPLSSSTIKSSQTNLWKGPKNVESIQVRSFKNIGKFKLFRTI